jgi:hypothetical protein
MNMDSLQAFIEQAGNQAMVLDTFVDNQRAVAGAVRLRDWQALEKALERAAMSAEAISAAEAKRIEAWSDLIYELDLPHDSTVFRASLAIPLEERPKLTDAYRNLRMAAMRARIENEALSGFVGNAEATLRQAMESLFPDRKGKIYSKTGRPHHAGTGAMVLDTAL